MSALIDVARVQQYKANVELLFQQKGSKLRGTARMDFPTGKQSFFERLGQATAQQRLTRHADTPQIDSQHSRRMVTLKDFEWADLIDQQDKLRMLIDPQSEYAVNGSYALGRALDNEFYTQVRGNALTGENGTTLVALPAAQKIAHGGVGMTKAKIIQAAKILNLAEVPMEDRFFVIESNGLEDLLNDTTITSADFNAVKLLMTGEIDTFMGFKWIVYNFAIVGTEYFAIAYHRSAVGIGMWKDITTRVSERDDKSYATQVYVCSSFGATRIQDNGLVEIAYQ